MRLAVFAPVTVGWLMLGTACLAQTPTPSSNPAATTAGAPVPAPKESLSAEPTQIKRLFFSAEKRASLDRQRTQNLQQIRSLQGATLNLDGLVQRSSGKSTVWINGQPQNENEAARNGVNVFLSRKSPGRAEIAPGDETPTAMRVGEVINRATGERDNRLGDGSVTTHDTRARTAR